MNICDLSDAEKRIYETRIQNQLKIEIEKMKIECPNIIDNWDNSDRWICYKIFDQIELTGNQPETEIVKQMKKYSTVLNQSDGSMPNVLWDDVRIENVNIFEK